jgi:beta-galactosidase GanA
VDTLLGVALILEPRFSCFLVGDMKVGRKYIMMGGMLLSYYTDQQNKNETTSVKKNRNGRKTTVLAELKEKKSKPWILSIRLTKGIQMEQL